MTLVSQIITDAFRQSNILGLNGTLTTAQQDEALRHLNRHVRSVFGYEAGESLTAIPVGRGNILRPSGYPAWDLATDNEWFIPKNTRLMLNLESATTLYLTPAPDDGARFGVVDVSGNLATYNLTIQGNGNKIDGATSAVLNENSYTKEWLYRADLGDWRKCDSLETTDTFPFPEEFDDFFITLLGIRLNPSYGVALDPQSQLVFSRSRAQLRGRYGQITQTSPDMPYRDETNYSNVNDMFNRGRTW